MTEKKEGGKDFFVEFFFLPFFCCRFSRFFSAPSPSTTAQYIPSDAQSNFKPKHTLFIYSY